MQHQFLNTSKVLQERGIQVIRAPSQTSQLGLNLRHVCLGVSHTLSGCFWVGGGSSRMLEMGQQLHSLQLFWPETLRNLTLFPIQFWKSWMLLRNKHNNLTRNGCLFLFYGSWHSLLISNDLKTPKEGINFPCHWKPLNIRHTLCIPDMGTLPELINKQMLNKM